MSVAMWNCHCWPLDVSSNVKLPFLSTRCQYQCEIAILDHYMSVSMWNCHCWPLHVSSSVKLPVFRTRCQHWGGGYIQQPIWVLHLKIFDSHLILITSSDRFLGGISDTLSGYLIWKFWLTSDLDHFIWQVLGGISDLFEHFIWKHDLPKWALTTIFHITPGKYEPS